MNDWIRLEEGRYRVERAVLVASDNTLAMPIADPMIEIYNDRRGTRHLKGYATIANHLLVDLLDESDEIDLILDLTGTFKYRLPHPQIRSGKMFSPDAHSTVQFFPTAPWVQIPEKEFEVFFSSLKVL